MHYDQGGWEQYIYKMAFFYKTMKINKEKFAMAVLSAGPILPE